LKLVSLLDIGTDSPRVDQNHENRDVLKAEERTQVTLWCIDL
jgi:hypothetical protein